MALLVGIGLIIGVTIASGVVVGAGLILMSGLEAATGRRAPKQQPKRPGKRTAARPPVLVTGDRT